MPPTSLLPLVLPLTHRRPPLQARPCCSNSNSNPVLTAQRATLAYHIQETQRVLHFIRTPPRTPPHTPSHTLPHTLLHILAAFHCNLRSVTLRSFTSTRTTITKAQLILRHKHSVASSPSSWCVWWLWVWVWVWVWVCVFCVCVCV